MFKEQVQNGVNFQLILRREEEEILINRTLNGDNAAFEQLYKENVGRVYGVCVRIISNSKRAEELTQDVFVKAWENLSSFRGESLFSTWIYKIAVNISLMELRSSKKRFLRFKFIDKKLNHTKKHNPAHSDSIDLEQAVSNLPDKARAVFVLHEIEGYKHEEIAEMMEINPGTSKAQLYRARNLLREALEK